MPCPSIPTKIVDSEFSSIARMGCVGKDDGCRWLNFESPKSKQKRPFENVPTQSLLWVLSKNSDEIKNGCVSSFLNKHLLSRDLIFNDQKPVGFA